MRPKYGFKRLTSMAMGKREDQQKQNSLWIAHTELASAPGHPFYEELSELLDAEGFDSFVEGVSARFYAEKFGRPSLLPGIYFRSMLIGYFEGIEAERGIAWRVADSLGLRRFLGIAGCPIHFAFFAKWVGNHQPQHVQTPPAP